MALQLKESDIFFLKKTITESNSKRTLITLTFIFIV